MSISTAAQSSHSPAIRRPVPASQTQGVLARIAHDKKGSTAIIFSLALYPILMVVGMAVDYGRAIGARNQMQAILDNAALAGGRAAQLASTDGGSGSGSDQLKAKAQEAAAAYFANMDVAQVISKTLGVVQSNASSTEFTWEATAWVKTPFLNAASIVYNPGALADRPDGCPTWWSCQKVTATSGALIQAGGNNDGYSLEISMMLDITGSMSGDKIDDLKAAAKDAVDILIWSDQSEQTSRIALVPFAEDVRLPDADSFAKATGGHHNGDYTDIGPYRFTKPNNKHCVVERQGTQKYTDEKPQNGQWATRKLVYSGWTQDCNVPETAALQPLTSDKAALTSKINALTLAGGTAGQIGTAWAWYTLSPEWDNLWPSQNRPKEYGTEKLKKIAILMTDGDYNTQYDANGIRTSVFSPQLTAANGSASTQASALCTGMKAKNIEVYTIGFMVSEGAKTMLKACATDNSHFYDASSGDALRMAFRDIALKVSSLRLSK